MEMTSDGKRFEFRQGNEAREVCRQEVVFDSIRSRDPGRVAQQQKDGEKNPASTSDVPIWCLRKIMNSKE